MPRLDVTSENAIEDARDYTLGHAAPNGSGIENMRAPEVEEAIVSAALMDEECATEAVALLNPRVFYDRKLFRVFEAIVTLFEQGQPIDLVTVTNQLRTTGYLDQVGGAYFVSGLGNGMVSATPSSIEYYARVLQEKFYLRSLRNLGAYLSDKTAEHGTDAFDLMDEVEQDIFALSSADAAEGPRALGADLVAHTQHLVTREVNDGVTGLDTGFQYLNELTGGWQDDELIIVAARPSVGKTSFGLGQALHVVKDLNKAVLFFSMEMSHAKLSTRLLASEAKVEAQKIRLGRLSESEKGRLRRKAEAMAGLPLYIDDTYTLHMRQLRARARQMAYKHDLGLVVVDYLQLAHGSRGDTREQEVASISRDLKALAKELHLPVMALAQLSRALEHRTKKRPQLSDLRESGGLENDADVVAFLHRPELYGDIVDENGDSTEGIAEVIIGKQRNGPLGTALVSFVKKYAQFRERDTFHTDPIM